MEYQTCLHTGRRGAEELESAENDDNDAELEADYSNGGSEEVWWERCTTFGSLRRTGKALVFGRSESLAPFPLSS